MRIRFKKGYVVPTLLCFVGGLSQVIRYFILLPEARPVRIIEFLTQGLFTFIVLLVPTYLVAYWYHGVHDKNPIIRHARRLYGKDFQNKPIDLRAVFNFDWKVAYLFSGKFDQDFISKTIGFTYNDKLAKEEHFLFLFVNNRQIVERFFFYESIFFLETKLNKCVSNFN